MLGRYNPNWVKPLPNDLKNQSFWICSNLFRVKFWCFPTCQVSVVRFYTGHLPLLLDSSSSSFFSSSPSFSPITMGSAGIKRALQIAVGQKECQKTRDEEEGFSSPRPRQILSQRMSEYRTNYYDVTIWCHGWDHSKYSNFITYGPRKAVAEVSNHNEPIGRKSGIQLVWKSMDFTFNCFVLNWQID